MKRKTQTTTTASIFFFMFLVLFLFHQFTLTSVSRSSSSSKNSTMVQEKRIQLNTTRYWLPQRTTEKYSESPQPLCDRSHDRYDLCTLKGPTVVDPTISTIFFVNPRDSFPPRKEHIRPYPRKWENDTMSWIKGLTLITSLATMHCAYQHEAPALVFSTGGYTGNLFHDFNDGFIPIFTTIRSIFPNRDPVFVITNCKDWWLSKYTEVLGQFTPYPIINLDKNTSTHCFPSATIGLVSHGYMTIDPKLLPNADTWLSFHALLGNAYAHAINHFPRAFSSRPRLVLVARTGEVGRVILNQAEVTQVAEQTGFEVIVFEPNAYSKMREAYGLINTSHAMLGVHGAGLTHSLFLRPGSVFIQVVPIGTDWLAETCFGKSARDLGLVYMEYKIGVKESSLLDKYGEDHLVLRNPKAITKEAFSITKSIYLKNQDIILDLERIGMYLRKAYTKAMEFMEKEG